MQPSTLIQELEQLIAIPSHEDCTPILHYLEKRLDFLRWERQDAGKQVGGRPQYNLIHLDPAKPFIVNTHVDTVPPLGMADPFRPRREEDRIYGRGAVDTKGLIAALTIALEACYQTYDQIPVSVAFTVDEENTSAAGSAALARLLGPDHYVLVLEPTNGYICTRQAGALEFEVRSYGTPRHAALFHRGPHPIRTLMAYLQAAENALQRPLNVLSFQGGWDHYATPPEARALVEVIIPDHVPRRGGIPPRGRRKSPGLRAPCGRDASGGSVRGSSGPPPSVRHDALLDRRGQLCQSRRFLCDFRLRRPGPRPQPG